LVGDILNMLQTDNLPVKFVARRSRHAAHDYHERFAAGPGQGFALFQTENPAIRGGRLIPAPGLSQQGCIRQNHHSKGEKKAHEHQRSSISGLNPNQTNVLKCL
jgi:hypothetical protein